MNVKEYINKMLDLKEKLQFLEEQKEIIYAKMTISAYDTQKISPGTKQSDVQETYILRYNEICEEIEKLNQEIERRSPVLLSIFEKLNNINYEKILTYKYIYDLSINDIAEKLCYSERHAFRLHRQALNIIQTITVEDN